MKILVETTSNTLVDKTLNELSTQANIGNDSIFYFDFEDKESFSNSVSEYLASSFLEDQKLVVLRHFDSWKNKTSKTTKEESILLEQLFEVNTENIFVFVTEKFNKDNKTYEKYSEEITVFSLPEPTGSGLNSFVEKHLEDKGIKISKKEVKRLIDITEGDFDNIVNELQKFVLMGQDVTAELIEKTVYDRKGESVFSLIDAIFNKEIDKIDSLVDKMKEQDQSIFAILAMLIGDISLMVHIKDLEMNYTESDIKEIIKINPYRYTKISNTAAKYQKEQLQTLLDHLVDLEIKLKSNQIIDIYNIFKAKIISWI